MTKNSYLLSLCIVGNFLGALKGMEIMSYDDIKKNASRCTLFAIEVLEQLNKEIANLKDKEGKVASDVFNSEMNILDNYVRDCETAVTLNAFYDEIENEKHYTVRSRNKLFFLKKKNKEQYVSQIVWENVIKGLKKKRDKNPGISLDGLIVSSSLYHATMILERMTLKRKELHTTLAFESFERPVSTRGSAKRVVSSNEG